MLQGQVPCSIYTVGPTSGTNPFKIFTRYIYAKFEGLSADLVRRSVGVASNGSQIVAIAQIYSGAEGCFR